jgi:hypothetical protein
MFYQSPKTLSEPLSKLADVERAVHTQTHTFVRLVPVPFLTRLPLPRTHTLSIPPVHPRSTPEVTVQTLDPGNEDAASFLIMACDGVWDVLSNEEAVSFVAEHVAKAGGPGKATAKDLDNVATSLKDLVLLREATASGMTAAQLREVRPGQRRKLHDDITALVVFFGPAYGPRRSIGAGMDGKGAGGGGGSSWKLW